MEQTSQAFDNYIMQDSREFKSRLLLNGNPLSSVIMSAQLKGGSNSEDDFSLGSAISQYIDVVATVPSTPIEGRELTFQIGVDIEGEEQWIDMGVFTVEKPKANEGEIKFTAYDRMMKMEMPYFSNLGANTNTVAMLTEIGQKTGVPIVTTGLSIINCKKIEGGTYREALSYISQIHGGFAICARDGKIYVKTYTDSNYTVPSARYWGAFDRNEFHYTLEKITCYIGKDDEGKNISISVGSGMREISFSNPYMTQAMLDSIWTRLKNYVYMPGSFGFLGDPRIDPWDVLTIIGTDEKHYKVPCMELNQIFDGGLSTEVEAVGKTEAEKATGFKGPNAQQQDRFLVELALINHALINKLDVDTAEINYATITALEAVDAKIQHLEVDYGEFKTLVAKDFTATKADITNLDANYANIRNLLSGSAGIGDLVNIHLTSENAVLDTLLVREQIAKQISVNDLMAGRIYTNRFEIWSDEDGGMKIFGATQQFTDGDGLVRMQAGLDADGAFNYYILDKDGSVMFDALNGIQAEGIKTAVITDSMVANGANIKGSKVLIDEVGQTLDIAFSSMYYNVSNAEANALDALNQVSRFVVDLSSIDLQLAQINEVIYGIVADDGTYILQTTVEGGSVDGTHTATIHARVYCANAEVTTTILPEYFLWTRRSEDAAGDEAWNLQKVTGYSITLTGEDVDMIATFQCTVAVPEEYDIFTMNDENITTMSGDNLLAMVV